MESWIRRSYANRPFARNAAKCSQHYSKNIITANEVFLGYAFAYPISNPTAVNTAKVIIDIMTRNAFLPPRIKTDKGSVFISLVIIEVAEKLSLNLKHATTKHAQTIGLS